MTESTQEIKDAVKAYILKEFLPGEDPDALEESTPLFSGGIMDSIATVKLVAFLEEKYGVEFEAHEMSAEYLDTLTDIAGVVESKIAAE